MSGLRRRFRVVEILYMELYIWNMGNGKVEAERTEAVLMRETIERYFLRASMRVK